MVETDSNDFTASQEDFYSLSVENSLNKFNSSLSGLTNNQVEESLKTHGLNEISEEKKKSLIRKIGEALIEPMTLILIIATLLLLCIIKDLLEAIAIVGVVIVNTVISLIQEGKAEKATDELKKILSPQSKVIRNGDVDIIAAKFLVPGDIIVFESGDIIPTDARIIDATNILVDEAHLTGESEAIQKTDKTILEKALKLYEMKNIVFAGSKVL